MEQEYHVLGVSILSHKSPLIGYWNVNIHHYKLSIKTF